VTKQDYPSSGDTPRLFNPEYVRVLGVKLWSSDHSRTAWYPLVAGTLLVRAVARAASLLALAACPPPEACARSLSPPTAARSSADAVRDVMLSPRGVALPRPRDTTVDLMRW